LSINKIQRYYYENPELQSIRKNKALLVANITDLGQNHCNKRQVSSINPQNGLIKSPKNEDRKDKNMIVKKSGVIR